MNHDTSAHVTLDDDTSAAIVGPFVANSTGWKKWQLWLHAFDALVTARLRRGIGAAELIAIRTFGKQRQHGKQG